jgi:hypothetical protein
VEERETFCCFYASENELVSGKITASFKMFRKKMLSDESVANRMSGC